VVEDLACGDAVVDMDGRPCSVRRVVHCGVGRTFNVRLMDGGQIAAGAAQPWVVEVGRGANRTTRIATTTELADLAARKNGLRIMRSHPVQMPGLGPRPLDAYVLGVLLGDGGLSTGTSVTVWTTELETRRRVEEALPAGARLSDYPSRHARCPGWGVVGAQRVPGGNPVLNALRELGLSGVRSFEKHVPAAYLWAPATDRLELLRGLLDTDGGVDAQGAVTFSSASARLAEDVVHLVRSLGGRCSLRVREQVTYSVRGVPGRRAGLPSFKVGGIRMDDVPFWLGRKADRVRPLTKTLHWSVHTVLAADAQPLLALDVSSRTGVVIADHFIPVTSYDATSGSTALSPDLHAPHAARSAA
jgi:hypothetical protein